MKEPLDNLKISGIFGSSSKSRTCFSASKDLVAYAASGGVVVAQVDTDKQQIVKQRFFCASSRLLRQESHSPTTVSKDSYGLIKPDHSIVIKGDTWNDSDDPSEKALTIGSDLSPARCSPSKIKDRIKDISCLNLSADGKFLIVGETGHQPRILLYSMASDSNDFPVFVIHQHSYGISQLQFHPDDSTIFTSLGLINDGFLHIWKLTANSVRLIASNKNSTIVLGLNWYKDSAIVTYGVRQIKVWKFENPHNAASNKLFLPRTRTAIKGKNIVLGSLIETTFIDSEWLRDDQLLFLTDSHQVVLYQNGSLISLYGLDNSKQYDNILVDWENDKLWYSYDEFIDSVCLTYLLNHQERLKPGSSSSHSRGGSPFKNTMFDQKFVDSDAIVRDKHKILMMKRLADKTVLYCTSKGEISLVNETIKQISNPSLNDISVFKKIDDNLAIVCSKKGDIKLFNGSKLEQYELVISELLADEEVTSLDFNVKENYIVVGDSSGKISIYNNKMAEYSNNIHSSAINDTKIYIKDNFKVVITVSRDRTINFIQLNDGGEWNICETLKENKGNIIQLEICDDKLYTISSDRTVSCYRLDIVDSSLNVSKENILSVKSSPLRLQLTATNIVVSRSDKTIQIFDKKSNALPRVLRLCDEQGDGILVNHFYVNADCDQILCSSSLDKTIRCFSFSTGKILNQYYAHADPVVGMITVADKLVTVTGNGCLFSWEMRPEDEVTEIVSKPLELNSGISTNTILSTPTTPIRNEKPFSPIRLQHPTPTSSPLRKESPISASNKRGFIPSNQLKSCKLKPQDILSSLTQLRISLTNEEELDNIEDIKKEVSMIHALLVPHDHVLKSFGDELMQLIESKVSN